MDTNISKHELNYVNIGDDSSSQDILTVLQGYEKARKAKHCKLKNSKIKSI
jgi:hypothetical protein